MYRMPYYIQYVVIMTWMVFSHPFKKVVSTYFLVFRHVLT